MSFTSYQFVLAFFPVTYVLLLLARSVPVQNIILLLSSLFFYASFNARYLFYLFLSYIVTYLAGLLMSQADDSSSGKRKMVFISGLVLNIALLAIPKYTGFVARSLNIVSSKLIHITPIPKIPEIALPIGLSFFVFQTSSYLLDVYRNDVEIERNPLTYLLFVSFFPTITSGPIQKSRDFLPVLREKREVSFTNLQRGILTFLWGAFLKMVIADRLSPFVEKVFSNYSDYGFNVLALGAIGYSLQIYTDFAGYSYMAIGLARCFGFAIKDNFRQPYFAVSIRDFWKRWHISLTSWLTNYLYIPLGGNRKGTTRKYVNVFIVFLISGLWHGADWSFIVWGCIHALLQIIEMLFEQKKSVKQSTGSLLPSPYNRIVTFVLVTIAWVFFRVDSTKYGFRYIARMLSYWDPWIFTDGSLLNLGLEASDWIVLIFSLAVLFGVSQEKEQGKDSTLFLENHWLIRLLVVLFLFFGVAIFGVYGAGYKASDFIYTGF